MKRTVRFSVLYAVMVLSLLASLAACGGGGGGGGGPVSGGTVLSGTVAAGAPIIGIVNVKGANGATASSTIAANGSFSLDVAALTANYVLYAQGTVNGKIVKIYSAAVAPGTINITPITDLILANALGAKPDDALVTSWTGSQVTAAELDAAKTTVQTAIAPLLTAMGATAVDPMTGSFSANGTGLDKALDYLQVNYSGSNATITNLATGSTCTNNVSTSVSTALPPADATATTAVMTEEASINLFWSTMVSLWSAGPPSQAAVDAQLAPLTAPDVLDRGETYAAFLTVSPTDDGPTGCAVRTVIEAPMVADVDYPSATYSKGYWTRLHWVCGPETGSEIGSAVKRTSDSQWLMYGNRRWIDEDIRPEAQLNVSYTNTVSLFTGFNFWLDDPFNYAHDRGVQSAVVTGAGLPAGGVKLALVFPNTTFNVYTAGPNNGQYHITDDPTIAAIPDNSIYTVSLYTQPTGSLTGGETPVHSFTRTIARRPYTNAYLQANASTIFPTLLSPTSHALSAANIGGPITAQWINAANTYPYWINIGISNNAGDQQYFGMDLNRTATSATINSSTHTVSNPTAAWLWWSADDIYGNKISGNWEFR